VLVTPKIDYAAETMFVESGGPLDYLRLFLRAAMPLRYTIKRRTSEWT
jgi:hypothetical protein